MRTAACCRNPPPLVYRGVRIWISNGRWQQMMEVCQDGSFPAPGKIIRWNLTTIGGRGTTEPLQHPASIYNENRCLTAAFWGCPRVSGIPDITVQLLRLTLLSVIKQPLTCTSVLVMLKWNSCRSRKISFLHETEMTTRVSWRSKANSTVSYWRCAKKV